MAPPARPAGPAAGQQVHGHPVPGLRGTGEALDAGADGGDDPGGLVARRHRIPLLVAGEQPPLESTDAAGVDVYEHLLGSDLRERVGPDLDFSDPCEHDYLHDASDRRRRRSAVWVADRTTGFGLMV
jgi:hypothetical protein